MGCRAICQSEAYHAKFPQHVINQSHPICHLEVLNVVVAITLYAQKYKGQLLHLFYDSVIAMAIFQAGRGQDTFLLSCVREVWLTCTIWDITLCITHMAREELTTSGDMLSHWVAHGPAL